MATLPTKFSGAAYRSDANRGAAFRVGVHCMYGAITGLFDNLRVVQFPRANATCASAKNGVCSITTLSNGAVVVTLKGWKM